MKNPTDVQQVEAMSLALIVYKLLFFSRQSLHSAKCPADNPGNPLPHSNSYHFLQDALSYIWPESLLHDQVHLDTHLLAEIAFRTY
jgi:hypothetical protein